MENPTKYSLSAGAKALGIAKSTMSEYIHNGRVSAVKLPSGGYEIDASELARAFPDAYMRHVTGTGSETPDPNGGEPSEPDARTPSQNSALAVEVKMLREMLERAYREKDDAMRAASGTIDDLRARLDREGEERRQLNAQLLTYQQPPAPPAASPPSQANPPERRSLFGLFKRAG